MPTKKTLRNISIISILTFILIVKSSDGCCLLETAIISIVFSICLIVIYSTIKDFN